MACHSTTMSLEAFNFYLTSVLLIPQHPATLQGKYIFKNKSIPTVKDALLSYFFHMTIVFLLYVAETRALNPSKPRV